MTNLDLIGAELARVREKIAELQVEERVLSRLLFDIAALNASTAAAKTSTASPTLEDQPPEGGASKRSAKPAISKRQKSDWTDEEVALLEAQYPKVGLKGVVPLLSGHTRLSIKTKVTKLGLRFAMSERSKRLWTPDEDYILATVYPTKGLKGVMELLPHRGEQSIYNRVSYKGVARRAARDESAKPADGGIPQAPPEEREPSEFEKQLARVERGEVGIAPVLRLSKALPERTYGGVATGMLS